ncbi:MAG: hypothetical protein HYR88_10860 [Verrucomicrobia bacterium]|nr:hypothetical protein [Verrucomicrobiota bacterium]MBI3870827.1 hypothetical protein [Verrucomicrobiota bacterium]
MERNGRTGATTNCLLLLAAAALCYGIARYSETVTGQLAGGALGFGALVGLVSWFHMRLEEQETFEQMEFDEVTRSKGGASLFNTTESETFPARRSRELFERFFIPIFTALLAASLGAVSVYAWQWIGSLPAAPMQQPLLALGLFGGVFLALFLMGQYSSGVAQLDRRRLLRPSANWMLLGAYLAAFTCLVLGVSLTEWARADFVAGRVLSVLFGALALEGAVSVVFDIYRPRVRGKAIHPLYDSRLVGLVSHPEGVFSTAASALDYQFGFKVSDTWFYNFLRTNFPWLLLGQLGLLLLSSAVVFINPGERALLERLGRPVAGRESLGPGMHLKWPFPIDALHRFRTEEIQSFTVGALPNEGAADEVAFVWSVSHFKNAFNLLTPSAALAATGDSAPQTASTNTPLGLLTVSIPIHFQISDLKAYAYNFENASNVLEGIANREVVRYFAQTDIHQLLSEGQSTAADYLRGVIQKRVDEMGLGVKLLFVGLQDIHPPVEVVKDYESVANARQSVITNILGATNIALMTNAYAVAEQARILAQAVADRDNRVSDATARASRFRGQMVAFEASPEIFSRRTFLKSYTNALADSRKYIMALTNVDLIPQVDLQDKISDRIRGMLTQPKSGKPVSTP